MERKKETRCEKCEIMLTITDFEIPCDIYEKLFHIECTEIPKSVYKFMTEKDVGKHLSWRCINCLKIGRILKKLKNIDDEISSEIDEKIGSMKHDRNVIK